MHYLTPHQTRPSLRAEETKAENLEEQHPLPPQVTQLVLNSMSLSQRQVSICYRHQSVPKDSQKPQTCPVSQCVQIETATQEECPACHLCQRTMTRTLRQSHQEEVAHTFLRLLEVSGASLLPAALGGETHCFNSTRLPQTLELLRIPEV